MHGIGGRVLQLDESLSPQSSLPFTALLLSRCSKFSRYNDLEICAAAQYELIEAQSMVREMIKNQLPFGGGAQLIYMAISSGALPKRSLKS
jgi:hypothetical protein